MKLFHGTDMTSAQIILGQSINGVLGGGEMGQGFYLGESVSLARAWSKTKGKNQPCLLELNINNSEFAKLNTRHYSFDKVYNDWKDLSSNSLKRIYLYHVDVVRGPIVRYKNDYQYKFESSDAISLLNNPSHTIITQIF